MTDNELTDARIRAAFEARAAGSPSPELAESIAASTRRTRQQPRPTLLPGGLGSNTQRLLWAAVISASSLALVGGLLLAGSRNDSEISVIPTETPGLTPSAPAPEPSASPAASPSSAPTPSVAPTEGPASSPDPALVVDGAAFTLVDELRVRSAPGVNPASELLEPLLSAHARLLVIGGPVAASGYNWYHVMPFDPTYPSGWVAGASRDLEPWIVADDGPCPELPLDASELAVLSPFGGLACYGDQEIQLIGDFACEIADVDRTIGGPEWLARAHYRTLDLGETTMEILDGGLGLGTPDGGIDEEGFPMT